MTTVYFLYPMKTKQKRPVAKEMTPAEVDKLLAKIGKALKNRRKSRTTIEAFAYELNMSRSQITRFEKGEDMLLSTFLKLLHGLDVEPGEFWREVK